MEPKANKHLRYIDGYKGLAIILVIIGHLNILNLGSVCNCIFFVVSGFLAVSPFKETDNRFRSIKDILYYYYGKIIRIIPSLYIVLLLVLLLTDEHFMPISKNISNFFLTDMYAHLWFVQQIMFMYLITPLTTLFFSLLSRLSKFFKSNLTKAIIALIIAAVFRFFLTPDYFYFRYSSGRIVIYLHEFLIGCAVAYFYMYIKNSLLMTHISKYKFTISSLQIMILVFIFLTSDQLLTKLSPKLSRFYFGREYPLICCLIVGLLLLLMVLNEDSAVAKLFSIRPLTFFGKISLQLYLIHWFLIPYIKIENLLIKSLLLIAISSLTGYILFKINELIAKKISLPPKRLS